MISLQRFIFLFVFLFSVCLGFGQENLRIKKKEFINKQDGAKEAWRAVRKGNSFYSQGKEFYKPAREQYLKAYTYNASNVALNYKIGICYLYSDNKTEAIKYLKKVFDLNNKATKDLQFQMGRAYQMNYDFTNAIKSYKLYKTMIPERKLRKMGIDLDKYISECEIGNNLIKEPTRVVVENLGKSINSEADDYCAVLDGKDETMYYTSRRETKRNNKRSEIDNKYSEDIYVSKKKSKDWNTSQLLSKRLFTKKSEAALAVTPDNSRLYIYKSNHDGNVYYSQPKNGKWSSLSSFSKINSGARETSVSFTGDGKTCYFVSDRNEDESLGGKDIYVIKQNAKGRWSSPQNLGPVINTKYNEDAVYVSKDGKNLYFSSNGILSMGGYDVFKSEMTESGSWSAPKNLGYPINTPDNDLYFSISENKRNGYISANRENSVGAIDIYKLIFLGTEKNLLQVSEMTPLAFEQTDKKSLIITKTELLTIDSSILLAGKVLDEESKIGLVGKIQISDPEKNLIVASLVSDSLGSYQTRLPQKKNYTVQINSKGYLFYADALNIKNEEADVFQKDFLLKELSVGAKVVLKNIFFETGKATLMMESYQQLDNVITFMKENPSLTLEISGHTDNVGLPAANTALSQNRAKSVVTYMINQGIDPKRLTFKGYGPKQPIASNKTKEGKAMNRRVEFKITGK